MSWDDIHRDMLPPSKDDVLNRIMFTPHHELWDPFYEREAAQVKSNIEAIDALLNLKPGETMKIVYEPPNVPWQEMGCVIRMDEKDPEMWKRISIAQKEAIRRSKANLDAALMDLPLPYPPPKETCPHCGEEIEP